VPTGRPRGVPHSAVGAAAAVGIRARHPSLERKLQVPPAAAGGGPRPGGRGSDGDGRAP